MLHADCWAEISHVDGYNVTLRTEPSSAREKLSFVNLGGYDARDFAEQHKYIFVVATSAAEAKANALRLATHCKDAHRAYLYKAEKAFALDTVISGRLYLHLMRSDSQCSPQFTCHYTPLR